MGLLALLVSELASSGQLEARRVANLRDSAVAEAAADGAVFQAVLHLLDSGAGRWPVRGLHRIGVGGSVVTLEIRSVAGLINPNTASLALIQALLRELDVDKARAPGLAAAILDWRTPGETAHVGGAKTAAYRAAGLTYGPPDAPFQDLTELSSVLGMTPDIAARLAPYLSVYAPDAPDPTLADPVVRFALQDAGEPGQRDDDLLPLTVSITADAVGPGGSRFRRHAVMSTADTVRGEVFHMLAWDQPPLSAGGVAFRRAAAHR